MKKLDNEDITSNHNMLPVWKTGDLLRIETAVPLAHVIAEASWYIAITTEQQETVLFLGFYEFAQKNITNSVGQTIPAGRRPWAKILYKKDIYYVGFTWFDQLEKPGQ